MYVIVGFMQRGQFNQQHHNKDTFYRLSVVDAQCIIRSEKHPDVGIDCKYALDEYLQAYGEIVRSFGHLGKIIFYSPMLHK